MTTNFHNTFSQNTFIMVLQLNNPLNNPLNNDEQHPDNEIHVPIIQEFIITVEMTPCQQQKMNILCQMFEYLHHHINWISAHPRFRQVIINKTHEFIISGKNNDVFVSSCNQMLRALGEPEFIPPQEDDDNDNDDSEEDDHSDEEDDDSDDEGIRIVRIAMLC